MCYYNVHTNVTPPLFSPLAAFRRSHPLLEVEVRVSRRLSPRSTPQRTVTTALSRHISHTIIPFYHRDLPSPISIAAVINALSDLHHPLQALADMLTLQVAPVFFGGGGQ